MAMASFLLSERKISPAAGLVNIAEA